MQHVNKHCTKYYCTVIHVDISSLPKAYINDHLHRYLRDYELNWVQEKLCTTSAKIHWSAPLQTLEYSVKWPILVLTLRKVEKCFCFHVWNRIKQNLITPTGSLRCPCLARLTDIHQCVCESSCRQTPVITIPTTDRHTDTCVITIPTCTCSLSLHRCTQVNITFNITFI